MCTSNGCLCHITKRSETKYPSFIKRLAVHCTLTGCQLYLFSQISIQSIGFQFQVSKINTKLLHLYRFKHIINIRSCASEKYILEKDKLCYFLCKKFNVFLFRAMFSAKFWWMLCFVKHVIRYFSYNLTLYSTCKLKPLKLRM